MGLSAKRGEGVHLNLSAWNAVFFWGWLVLCCGAAGLGFSTMPMDFLLTLSCGALSGGKLCLDLFLGGGG